MTASFTPPAPPPEARARRRRARRTLFPSDAEGQAAVLAELAARSYPSFELFLYAILSGAILAAGYLLDSQAVLIFGVLAAPLLTPWVGMCIAAITGSPRFFFQTLAALLVSAFLVLLIGLAAGFASLPFEPRTHNEIYPHAALHLPDLVILALGAFLLILSFIRSPEKPYLSSAVLAYAFYLPISAAGFGLGAKIEGAWPNAALVFVAHFAISSLIGILTLAVMRFRPRSFGGLIFTLILVLALLTVTLNLTTGFEDAARRTLSWIQPPTAQPTPLPLPSPTAGWSPSPRPNPSPSRTPSPLPKAASPTITERPVSALAADTSTPTITIVPTPIFARINSPEGGGARVRNAPGGDYLMTLNNGFIVEVLGPTEIRKGVTWVKIAVDRNGERIEGWIIQSLLATATPVVNWQPTGTATPTP